VKDIAPAISSSLNNKPIFCMAKWVSYMRKFFTCVLTMKQMAPKYHYSSEHFTKLYVTVAATRIKPDDPYKKVTEEGVSSLFLDHLHFSGAETGSKYRQGVVQEEVCLWVFLAP
jgi:hypothetical protein